MSDNVLKNGVEVKLQRNALSVLEHPTGNEEEDFDCESSTSTELGDKDIYFCSSSTELSRPSKARISRHAKSTNRFGGYKEVQSIHTPQWNVNFGRLEVDSLRRYCGYFNLGSNQFDPSREQLIISVRRHFYSQLPLDEVPVITEFVKAAKKRQRVEGSFAL